MSGLFDPPDRGLFLQSEKDTAPYWETERRGMFWPVMRSGYNNARSWAVPEALGGHGISVMHDIMQGKPLTLDEINHGAQGASNFMLVGGLAGNVGSKPKAVVAPNVASNERPANAFYHGSTGRKVDPEMADEFWGTTNKDVANAYAMDQSRYRSHPPAPSVRDLRYEFKNPYVYDAKGAHYEELARPDGMKPSSTRPLIGSDEIADFARRRGYDGAILKNINDPPNIGDAPVADSIVALQRGTVFDPYGNLVFSNPKQGAVAPLMFDDERRKRRGLFD